MFLNIIFYTHIITLNSINLLVMTHFNIDLGNENVKNDLLFLYFVMLEN